MWPPANSRRQWITLMLSVMALVVGCGDGRPATAPVSGTVTYQGQPLKFGIVMFQPDAGHPASGKIQPDGSFVLETYNKHDGAIVGEHRVRVSCTEQHRQAASGTAEAAATEAMQSPSLIPEKYDNLDTSGLKFTVKEGEPNVFAIELQ